MRKLRQVSLILVVLGILPLLALPAAAQRWQYVALLASDASAGESSLSVELLQPVEEGRQITIETRDGTFRETYEVRHIYDYTIILEGKLRHEFLSGAKIYQ